MRGGDSLGSGRWARLRIRLTRPGCAIHRGKGRRTIDHITLSGDLAAEYLGVISNIHQDGNLSDHFGIVADLSVREP